MENRFNEKVSDNCRKIILEDKMLKEIDAVFYDLLDAVENTIAAQLEDAYIEYGTRAIGLAYAQGLIDAGEQKQK